MAKRTLARRTATVVAVAGTATATLAVNAESAVANHKDYCDHGTHYGTHAGNSYRVVYLYSEFAEPNVHLHVYADQQQVGPNQYETIGTYRKHCGEPH